MDETKKPNPRPQAPKGAADYMKRHPELLYRVAVKKEDSNDDS
jgi:hypothetical protein